MKSFIITLAFIFALPVSAFSPVVSEPSVPYEAMVVDNKDSYQERILLGDLEQFPDMYELTFDKEVEFSMQLKQEDSNSPQPFSLLMVKVNADGSVSEVFRHKQEPKEWTRVADMMLGFNLLEDEVIKQTIGAGTYRLEVSTPDNEGEYVLIIGDEPVSHGYFTTLGGIYTTQQHFGYTWLRFLLSSYVHYPLGIMLVLIGIVYTWKKRFTIKPKNV